MQVGRSVQYPKQWEVRRMVLDGEVTREAEPPSLGRTRNVRAWAVVYGVLGVLACVVILTQAGMGHPGRFLLYLACANVAAFGLRLTSAKSVLPAGFLFLMLGIEDLTLPELLFIAISITLLREVGAVRRLPDAYGLLYAIAGVALAGLLRNPGVNIGSPYLLGPIAAVVIGGASLTGELASPVSTWAAAFFLAGLTQMMRVMGLPTALQFVVFGLVIVGGMLVSGDRIIRGVEHLLRERKRTDLVSAGVIGPGDGTG